MERVTGIGGVFFKARDPAAMAAWYSTHLGVGSGEGGAEFLCGSEQDAAASSARTVWSLFPADTDYFGPGPSPFMINYRVANLDALLQQLREADVKIEKEESVEYGKFAWITDPEGNRIELWQPIG